MHRKIVRPYGQSITSTRALSLLMMLALLWMLYDWTRNPVTWKWLATAKEVQAEDSAVPSEIAKDRKRRAPAKEVIVPGPNDLDPDAVKDFQRRKELLSDRTELRPREMMLYWDLMKWSRTESLQTQEKRAAKDVAFSQIWEQPDQYRGKLIRLRMHVRRVLHYTAPENPLGIKDAYEAWGWTDDSKSYPYVVVFSELPPGLPVGTDVRGEIVFVGYFLKIMTFKAFDVARGSPLLIGRARLAAPPVPIKKVSGSSAIMVIASIVGLIALAVFGIRHMLSFRRVPTKVALPEGFDLSEQLGNHNFGEIETPVAVGAIAPTVVPPQTDSDSTSTTP
ncbi:MAG: hypothetical protein V4719_27860 [Planctomycetota bacterium]